VTTVRYVLGIDSGGSKFLVKACGMDGAVIGEHTGDPAPHYRLPRDELLARVGGHIDRCLAQFGGRREDCAWVVCGTTGIDADSDRDLVRGIYAALEGFDCPMRFVNDAEVAHFAVTGGVGAVVIAGTGSVAFGRNAAGETARSGGWPIAILGDEGSGTWVGRRALHHLTLWFDERVPSTTLTERLCQRLGIERREDLMGVCVQIERMTWRDPGVAAIVDEAASAGDPYAMGILDDAAGQTFGLVDAVIRRLRLHQEPTFRVGAWGSAIVRSQAHFDAFRTRLEARYHNVEVVIADVDAATGACRMALASVRAAAPAG